jgi:hypothetical protein
MKVNYAVICFKEIDENLIEVKHKCLYEEKPSENCLDDLMRELNEDVEFNMVGDDDYEMMVLNYKEYPDMFESFDIPTEIED